MSPSRGRSQREETLRAEVASRADAKSARPVSVSDLTRPRAGLLLGGTGPRVAGVLFDLGGTLDADGLGWGERFQTLLHAELPEAPASALAAATAAGERRVLDHPRAATLGLEEMVALHVTAQLERLGAADPARASRLTKRFFEETSATLGARRTLLARLARRVRLGVVSNGCGNTARLLGECGLAECFTSVVDSSEIGVWKPDPGIFAPALAALDLAANEVAMVGDRLDRDVEAAAAAGLRSVWVSGGRPLDPMHPIASQVDLVIASVDALDPGDES